MKLKCRKGYRFPAYRQTATGNVSQADMPKDLLLPLKRPGFSPAQHYCSRGETVTAGKRVAGGDNAVPVFSPCDGTAGDVIKELLDRSLIKFKEEYNENDIEKLFKNVMILINGKNIRYLDGMDTVISENDTVVILKAMIGG